ncbi:hypothetical protein B0O80DRAFT_430128 [Mortierella sp. GBAus27b]|nr:hypothetical protein B0O80DRAFT_430128 [Mortierella sp. GBAus27b]
MSCLGVVSVVLQASKVWSVFLAKEEEEGKCLMGMECPQSIFSTRPLSVLAPTILTTDQSCPSVNDVAIHPSQAIRDTSKELECPFDKVLLHSQDVPDGLGVHNHRFQGQGEFTDAPWTKKKHFLMGIPGLTKAKTMGCIAQYIHATLRNELSDFKKPVVKRNAKSEKFMNAYDGDWEGTRVVQEPL